MEEVMKNLETWKASFEAMTGLSANEGETPEEVVRETLKWFNDWSNETKEFLEKGARDLGINIWCDEDTFTKRLELKRDDAKVQGAIDSIMGVIQSAIDEHIDGVGLNALDVEDQRVHIDIDVRREYITGRSNEVVIDFPLDYDKILDELEILVEESGFISKLEVGDFGTWIWIHGFIELKGKDDE